VQHGGGGGIGRAGHVDFGQLQRTGGAGQQAGGGHLGGAGSGTAEQDGGHELSQM